MENEYFMMISIIFYEFLNIEISAMIEIRYIIEKQYL